LDTAVPVYQDNQSAMLIYAGHGQFKRSKHMVIKRNYIKDLISHGIIEFNYLSSLNMLADPLTKPVSISQLSQMLASLQILKIDDIIDH
jgi:hypothetical protein